MEVQTVRKQQPNLQMQAYSINLYSVFDIASALQWQADHEGST